MDPIRFSEGLLWGQTIAILGERIPAAEMLKAISRSEMLGPVLDPTLWIRGQAGMEIVKRYLEATARWQAAARVFLGEMERTQSAAARARDAFRREAQQEQAAAGASLEAGRRADGLGMPTE